MKKSFDIQELFAPTSPNVMEPKADSPLLLLESFPKRPRT
jgi:hypothetical protein